jgi:hypothetical protein
VLLRRRHTNNGLRASFIEFDALPDDLLGDAGLLFTTKRTVSDLTETSEKI